MQRKGVKWYSGGQGEDLLGSETLEKPLNVTLNLFQKIYGKLIKVRINFRKY